MGYHVTILRIKDRRVTPITKDEVKSFVALQSELELGESEIGDFEIIVNIDGVEPFQLVYQNGQLWTKNPDNHALKVMINIADKLDASVRGDEGEIYDSNNESLIYTDPAKCVDEEEMLSKKFIQKNRRQTLIINISIFLFFVLLALLASIFDK